MTETMQIKAVTNTYSIWENKSSVVPNAPMFYFKNVGNTDMWVDEILLKPGEKFGVDHSLFLATFWAAGKNVSVIENTTYKVRFGIVVADDSGSTMPTSGSAPAPTPKPAGIMVTTQYKNAQ